MKFTDRQEQMVGHFLHQTGYIVKNLSPPAQTQTLLQVRERLYTELLLLPGETLQDDDLSVLLDQLRVSPTGWLRPSTGPRNRPAKPLNKSAAPVETSKSAPAPTRLTSEVTTPSPPASRVPEQNRRLLGVCIVLSERMDFPLRFVRAAFVTAGLTTGPFALIAYLGLYFEMSLARREPEARSFAPLQLAKIIGFTIVPLTLLYAVATFALTLLDLLYELVSSPAGLGAWERFSDYNGPLFLASLLTLVPIAVLSGLPIPLQSRAGIRRCLESGLSIYAVVLSIGIASRLTGFLIAFAQGYNG